MHENEGIWVHHCGLNKLACRTQMDQEILRRFIVNRHNMYGEARTRMVRRNWLFADRDDVCYPPFVQ